MTENERLIVTSAACESRSDGVSRKDSEGILPNEPVIFQNWGTYFPASVYCLINNKWAILMLFARTICHRTELILWV